MVVGGLRLHAIVYGLLQLAPLLGTRDIEREEVGNPRVAASQPGHQVSEGKSV